MDPDFCCGVSSPQRRGLFRGNLVVSGYGPARVALRVDEQNVAVAKLQAEDVCLRCEHGQNGASIGQFWVTFQHLLSLPSLQRGNARPFLWSKWIRLVMAIYCSAPRLAHLRGEYGAGSFG